MVPTEVRQLVLVALAAGGALWFRQTSPFPSLAERSEILQASLLRQVGLKGDFRAIRQSTHGFADGKWSGDQQLLGMAREVRAAIEFKLPELPRGIYDVFFYGTRATDFGTIQNFLDGVVLGGELDLFSRNRVIESTGGIFLGKVTLTENAAVWKVEVTGRNSLSRSPFYQFGLDGLRLVRRDD